MNYSINDLVELQKYLETNYNNYKELNKTYLDKMAYFTKNGILTKELFDINKKMHELEDKYQKIDEIVKINIEKFNNLESKLSKEASEILLPFDFNLQDIKDFDKDEEYDVKEEISEYTNINYSEIEKKANEINEKKEILDSKIQELLNIINSNELDNEYIQRANTYFNNIYQITTSLTSFSKFLKYVSEEYQKIDNWITKELEEISNEKN